MIRDEKPGYRVNLVTQCTDNAKEISALSYFTSKSQRPFLVPWKRRRVISPGVKPAQGIRLVPSELSLSFACTPTA